MLTRKEIAEAIDFDDAVVFFVEADADPMFPEGYWTMEFDGEFWPLAHGNEIPENTPVLQNPNAPRSEMIARARKTIEIYFADGEEDYCPSRIVIL